MRRLSKGGLASARVELQADRTYDVCTQWREDSES